MGILPWSPLAGGFLSGKYTRDTTPEDARRVNFDFPPINKEHAYDIIDVMKRIGDELGVSVAQIALAWMLRKPQITSIIIGAKTKEQLLDNIKATEVQLSTEQMAELDQVSIQPKPYPQWMIERQGNDRVSGSNWTPNRSSVAQTK